MINSLNSLNELSDIYLGSISEEDNSPEAIKARVMQHVRAIRYRARKEGETLNKAYNEFMGGQSGISSTEKQMVKERLGLTGGSAHVGEGYQRDPEQSKKDKTHSKQPDPSEDGFTGIGNMSIKDIMKMNAKIKAKTKKEETSLADMRKASNLSLSDDPKDQDEARKIKTQMDYEDLLKQRKTKKEGFSDWRTDLREIADDMPATENQAEKKVKEKKVKNKVTINPVQGQVESFAKSLGGEVLELYEVKEPEVDDDVSADGDGDDDQTKEAKKAADREKRMKLRLLRLKMKSARADVPGIVAHYEPEGTELNEEFIEEKVEFATEYFLNEGINEEGIDIIIEEIGLEAFVDFITEDVQELSEERAARRASVRAKSYADVKADVDKKDAAKKAAKKGEYAPSYAKKETDVTVYDDKPAAKKKAAPAKKAPVKKSKIDYDGDKKLETPKQEHRGVRNKKITKAVTKAKIKQPEKKATKQGLGDKIRTAYKAGVKRHRKATQGARVFGKGFAAGAKKAVKFAKDVKKVVSEEELAEKDTYTVKDGSGKKYEFGTHPAFKPGAKRPKSKVKPFKTEYDPSDDDTFDPHEAEATRGQSGRGTAGKMNVRKRYSVKEGNDTRRTVDAIRAYDRSKDASRDATADTDEGKTGKAKKEKAYAKKERGEIKKDDPNWKHKKYHTGMHGESLEIQDADGNLAFEVVDVIKAPPMKTVKAAAQYDLDEGSTPRTAEEKKKMAKVKALLDRMQAVKVASKKKVKEDYESKKTGEVLAAFKRDPKVRKRFEKAAKKDKGPGTVRNQAADDMLQTAKDIAKRKGDTSKSDDRYAYEQVEVKKNPKGRHPRDQKELERAQEYIRKNPNFGKVSEAKDAALEYVRNKYKGQIYDPKKKQSPEDKAKVAAERKKRQDADNKAYAARAKKAGFKSTQDYTDVVARYGSEDNYNKGRGLGS